MTLIWSEIPAAEKTDLIELEVRLVITMNVSCKINIMLEIKTCEDFIEFIGLSICVI